MNAPSYRQRRLGIAPAGEFQLTNGENLAVAGFWGIMACVVGVAYAASRIEKSMRARGCRPYGERNCSS